MFFVIFFLEEVVSANQVPLFLDGEFLYLLGEVVVVSKSLKGGLLIIPDSLFSMVSFPLVFLDLLLLFFLP
jgi:hypothetical protein